MRQQLLWRCSLTPGTTEVRRGLKGSASSSDTHGLQGCRQNNFIQGFGERSGRSTLSAVLRRADLEEKRRVREDAGWARHLPPPPQSAQTPIRITRISSLTRAL